jgi:PadR family transcriptional regulator, regulatory protein PadR
MAAHYLAELELYVLAAVAQLGDTAYGVTIRDEIESRSGRPCAFGAVYTTLERLASKGFITFSISEPEPVPGGRARKHAKITTAGHRALKETVRAIDRMVDGLGVRPSPARG